MKLLKVKIAAFGLLFAIAASVFLTSCEQSTIDTVTDHSGKEYFRAIFLMEGDLAAQIPSFDYLIEYRDNQLAEHPEMAEDVALVNEMLETSVERIDPNFFDELKAAVESNNAGKIEAILNKGNDLVRLADIQGSISVDPVIAQEMEKLDASKYDFNNQEDIKAYIEDAEALLANFQNTTDLGENYAEGRCFATVAVVAGAFAAVAVGVVVVVSAAVWFVRDYDGGTGVYDAADTSFVSEKLVTEIANLSSSTH